MVSQEGKLKVADFGISAMLTDTFSRNTGHGPGSGTPAYMSPQQALGKTPSHLDDLYDLGGNVWQWCEDRIEPMRSARVLRGASWVDAVRENLLSSARLNAEPDNRGDAYGFRCVLSDAPVEKTK